MKTWASFVTLLLPTARCEASLVSSRSALPTKDKCAGAPSPPKYSLPAHLTLLPTHAAGSFIRQVDLLVMYFDMQIFSCQFLSLQASQQLTGSTDQKL